MKRQFARWSEDLARHQALLVALSSDLALPLVQIKTAAELIETGNFSKPIARDQSRAVAMNAEAGLKLIEAYRLLLSSDNVSQMVFEPVAVGAVLEQVAHELVKFAGQYNTSIEVDVQGRPRPVLVNQASLSMAMQSLGTSLIRAQAAQDAHPKHRLVLGAHRSGEGLVAAGVFSELQGLSDNSLRAAHSLAGKARQPLPAIPPGAASGVLIADLLCAHLWQPLRSAAHRSLDGLATNLPTSKQMQLV